MTSFAYTKSDIEKNEARNSVVASAANFADADVQDGAVSEKYLAESDTFFGKFQRLALKYRMEARGIERVPEDERIDKSAYSPGLFWWAVNMVLSPVSIGALGISVFGLTFWDSALTIIFFTILGTIPVAFYSLFGPEFGLRQIVLSRFWFGYHGVKIFAILNAIGCIGWSAVNTVNAASILHSINGGGLPTWAGMLIVAGGTMILTLFGYRTVHFYERWAWLPTFVIFLIIIARLAKSHTFAPGTLGSGQIEAGNVLSFGAALFGSATGWATYASDYAVYQRKDANRIKLFCSVLFGVSFPLIFTGILGAALMAAAANTPELQDAYNENGIGGLLYGILVTDSLHGFGQFCLVLLALSTIAASCANIYSIAFSIQAISHYFAVVPRILWTFIGICAFYGISVGAYYNFESYMDNFMNIIGYWLSIYEAISLPEHFWFKGGLRGYNIEDIAHPDRLPPGYATLFSFCCGVAGIVVGMYQVWWTGPIARMIPGDLGFELTFAFTFVAYMVTRPIELKYFGR
ncbi:permease for cytosine/purines, uracil, thiamine, allantoin-domain-containing protein [Lipomyces kononenkoae]|uniref:Permease for cytosine/purines, uracil, thiamine, allantoin-domain-containing protein n=1 Tax=Lipomyces kononenkoae TaxID=34357 RepID=A0ACC3T3W2_LIPKO